MPNSEFVDFENLEKADPEQLMHQLRKERLTAPTSHNDQAVLLTQERTHLLRAEILRRLRKLPEIATTLGKVQIELEVCQGRLAQAEAELASLRKDGDITPIVRFFED